MSKELALAAKGRGNAAFGKKDFETAINEFTEAIKNDPTDHVFFSNRSGSYASLGKYEEALKDADQCIEISPAWSKGYVRKGLALLKMKKLDEAKEAYDQALKIEPGNAGGVEGLRDVENEKKKGKGGGIGALFGEQMWTKLSMDPTTREYLNDPAFRQKMTMIQQNPNMFGSFASDPQVSAALGVILGLGSAGFQTAPGGEDEDGPTPMEAEPTPGPSSAPKPTPTPAAQPEPEPEPEPEEEITEEEKQAEQNKKLAVLEKNKGNVAYKKRDFETALMQYNKAIELDPTAAVYVNNLAAVYFETKDYETCVAKCKEAADKEKSRKGYDFNMVAKSYNRMGNAYDKWGKMAEAEEAYEKALMEDYNDAAKKALKRVKAKRKKMEEESYLDDAKSEEAKEKGNVCFAAGKWQDAIEEYTEALKRNPKNYKVMSNRAACYTKLMAWQQGMEDCEACLKLDPKFVKAYIRKGKIQHFLKQYHKALVTFDQGLSLDPKCTDLVQARQLTMQKISEENSQGVDPQRQAEAMKDPEIQAILRDPMVSNVLQQMQENPGSASADRAMRDPSIRAKIEKLMAAGILRMG